MMIQTSPCCDMDDLVFISTISSFFSQRFEIRVDDIVYVAFSILYQGGGDIPEGSCLYDLNWSAQALGPGPIAGIDLGGHITLASSLPGRCT